MTLPKISGPDLRQTLISKTDVSSGKYADDDKTDTYNVENLAPLTKRALYDPKIKHELQQATLSKTNHQCQVCCSPYFPVFQEWIAFDNMSPIKCAKMAWQLFSVEIDQQSFRRHRKNHMKSPELIRRIMISLDPNIQPEKIMMATIQVLQNEMIETGKIDCKLSSELREWINLMFKYRGDIKEMNGTYIQQNTLNVTQGGSIPNSEDTKLLLSRPMTDAEQARMEQLGLLLDGKGTKSIRSEIPQDVPKIASKKIEESETFFTDKK